MERSYAIIRHSNGNKGVGFRRGDIFFLVQQLLAYMHVEVNGKVTMVQFHLVNSFSR